MGLCFGCFDGGNKRMTKEEERLASEEARARAAQKMQAIFYYLSLLYSYLYHYTFTILFIALIFYIYCYVQSIVHGKEEQGEAKQPETEKQSENNDNVEPCVKV
ncbi:hypothetical protein Lalb_Chr23g0267531 [Lupinus albus]|uniref:Transmembrane protein n=1 Tax=Lupinus albus TaxID=3870 RepID=A0A6A4NBE2_LUPAL|nr:hypothetical protein Lalb_Chr23g0267531 [Lupinus albus]